jgi:hypothetical protein
MGQKRLKSKCHGGPLLVFIALIKAPAGLFGDIDGTPADAGNTILSGGAQAPASLQPDDHYMFP